MALITVSGIDCASLPGYMMYVEGTGLASALTTPPAITTMPAMYQNSIQRFLPSVEKPLRSAPCPSLSLTPDIRDSNHCLIKSKHLPRAAPFLLLPLPTGPYSQ